MKPLSEMTLAEFINQRAQWDLMTAAERAAWYDERDRRQRMLDAAEGMAAAAAIVDAELFEPPGGATYHNASSLRKSLAAYQAAKENR